MSSYHTFVQSNERGKILRAYAALKWRKLPDFHDGENVIVADGHHVIDPDVHYVTRDGDLGTRETLVLLTDRAAQNIGEPIIVAAFDEAGIEVNVEILIDRRFTAITPEEVIWDTRSRVRCEIAPGVVEVRADPIRLIWREEI